MFLIMMIPFLFCRRSFKWNLNRFWKSRSGNYATNVFKKLLYYGNISQMRMLPGRIGTSLWPNSTIYWLGLNNSFFVNYTWQNEDLILCYKVMGLPTKMKKETLTITMNKPGIHINNMDTVKVTS